MGGEKYELAKPEAFLFGENSDLDILGDKPVLVGCTESLIQKVELEFRREKGYQM